MPARVPMKTLKVMYDGRNGRLSPDLRAVSDSYAFRVDQKHRTLILDPNEKEGDRLMVWGSNRDRSRSGMISLRSIWKELGVSLDDVKGKLYDVSVTEEGLKIQF